MKIQLSLDLKGYVQNNHVQSHDHVRAMTLFAQVFFNSLKEKDTNDSTVTKEMMTENKCFKFN